LLAITHSNSAFQMAAKVTR